MWWMSSPSSWGNTFSLPPIDLTVDDPAYANTSLYSNVIRVTALTNGESKVGITYKDVKMTIDTSWRD